MATAPPLQQAMLEHWQTLSPQDQIQTYIQVQLVNRLIHWWRGSPKVYVPAINTTVYEKLTTDSMISRLRGKVSSGNGSYHITKPKTSRRKKYYRKYRKHAKEI